jgi:hypothetical protein
MVINKNKFSCNLKSKNWKNKNKKITTNKNKFRTILQRYNSAYRLCKYKWRSYKNGDKEIKSIIR